MEKIEKELNLKTVFIILCICFISPSIVYLISGKKIFDLISSFTFFYTPTTAEFTPAKIVGTIFFVGIFLGIAFVYFKILKNHEKIFKNKEDIAKFVLIIGIIFFIMLLLTSTDVFYYIGTGWSEAHYGINPYYTTVSEVLQQNEEAKTDEILLKMQNTWSNQTIVYGPIWPFICKILSGLSMGNLTLALFIYKLFNLILHLVNTYLVHKITKGKNIFTLMYALNPLLLFDGITNVHNEMLVIFFILTALYFFIRKKNIFLTVIFFALATAVKYFAILLIPFIILYHYRKEKPLKKIAYSALWALLFIVVLVGCYLLYMRDAEVLKGIMTQQGKFSNSIFIYLAIRNIDLALTVSRGFMLAFVIIYIANIVKLIFTEQNYSFQEYIRKYNWLLALFIFATITNFQSWYTLWLLPTIFWQSSKNIKRILNLTIIVEVSNVVYFLLYENFRYCQLYVALVIILYLLSIELEKINENRRLVLEK